MIWCDRLAVVWACLLYGLYFLLIAGGTALFDPAFVFRVLWIVILPPWIFLRLLDWLAGGPSRRRALNGGRHLGPA